MDDFEPNINEQLLNAVRHQNLERVEQLLTHPELDLEYDLGDGSTVLFEGLYVKNEQIVTKLLDRGYDVNWVNGVSETPLHVAVIHSPANLAHELIKRGAHVDTSCCNKPVIGGAFYGNLEALSLLLYYDVDANVLVDKKTALAWALDNDNNETAKLLLNFNDFTDDADSLLLSVTHESDLTLEIFNRCNKERVNWEDSLQASLWNESNAFFKMILPYCIGGIGYKFLDYFFRTACKFSTVDWWESWHLMLRSFEIELLSWNTISRLQKGNFLENMLQGLHCRSISQENRLKFLCLFLSHGLNVTIDDFSMAYDNFDFDADFEVLIYSFNYYVYGASLSYLPPFLKLLLLVEQYPSNIVGLSANSKPGYFALSWAQKNVIRNSESVEVDIVERLVEIPEIPSLLELSRNQGRYFIASSFSIKKAYEFYDVIKCLNLPVQMQRILCLKVPIY